MRNAHPPAPAPRADPDWRIAVVHSSFYPEETGRLVAGAVRALREAGIPERNISLCPVPGAFEIPVVGRALAEAGAADGMIALGIVVEGETHHARLVAQQCARGVMDVQTRFGVPFAFEVLYTDDLDIARARLGKGKEAAEAVLRVLHAKKYLA